MICKLVKWAVIGTAVVGGAGFLLFGTSLGSYVGTMAASIKDGVVDNIPVDFEIKRAEKLIQAIEPQIDSCRLDVARSEVELDRLQASVVELEKTVQTEQARLQSGSRLLTGEVAANCSLTSEHLERRRVEIGLQRTLDSFRNNQSILKTKRALIERQLEAVTVAKQRLGAVCTEKATLEDQVRALKTQQQWVEQMAAGSHRFNLDDSALSKAKEALAKVRNRLDVAQKMLENDVAWHGDDVIAAAAPGRDVLKEIEEEFAQNHRLEPKTIAVGR
jgi:chromosome segregation ATPase